MNDVEPRIVDYHAVRRCNHCNELQYKSVHCLGMNPPKYLETWVGANDLTLHTEENQKIVDDYGRADIYVDGAGGLFVLNDKYECFSLKPGTFLGMVEEQGPITTLGKHIIEGKWNEG